MRYTDIREIKMCLRDEFKYMRRSLPPEEKKLKDSKILERLVRLPEYREAPLILSYVSTSIEVDTRLFIEKALADGKRVAVPRCVPGRIDMNFYLIGGVSELEPGTFGVLEPVPDRHTVLERGELPGSLCILPGLGFDLSGYRLGYGKGYYDRFLSRYSGVTAGVCYAGCLKTLLPHGRYDRPADILVTEKFTKRYNKDDSVPVCRRSQ